MIFLTGAVAYTSSRFGNGMGIIFLDDVACRGNETSLLNCSHPGIGVHNCDHTDDAGVACYCKISLSLSLSLSISFSLPPTPSPSLCLSVSLSITYCKFNPWQQPPLTALKVMCVSLDLEAVIQGRELLKFV